MAVRAVRVQQSHGTDWDGQLRGRPGRILANAGWSGAITAVTFAALFLAVKLFFFSLDPGYRDEKQGGSFTCAAGPECVYERYLGALKEHTPLSGASLTKSFVGTLAAAAAIASRAVQAALQEHAGIEEVRLVFFAPGQLELFVAHQQFDR